MTVGHGFNSFSAEIATLTIGPTSSKCGYSALGIQQQQQLESKEKSTATLSWQFGKCLLWCPGMTSSFSLPVQEAHIQGAVGYRPFTDGDFDCGTPNCPSTGTTGDKKPHLSCVLCYSDFLSVRLVELVGNLTFHLPYTR